MTPSKQQIKEIVDSGNWMLRRSNGGKACHNGFQWAPLGEWTEAPDWNPKPVCGGGLHGCGPDSSGWYSDGSDIEFCSVEDHVDIDGTKIKCRRSMIIMRNTLPEGLHVGGEIYGRVRP